MKEGENDSNAEERFERLWNINEKSVVQLARSYVGQEADALDIAQAVALAAYKHIRKEFKNGPKYSNDQFRSWLLKRVRWLSLDSFESVARRKEVHEEHAQLTVAQREYSTEIKMLLSLIERLPKQQRKVMNRLVKGESVKEIAKTMGIDESTVRSHRRNAKVLLSSLLGETSKEGEK